MIVVERDFVRTQRSGRRVSGFRAFPGEDIVDVQRRSVLLSALVLWGIVRPAVGLLYKNDLKVAGGALPHSRSNLIPRAQQVTDQPQPK